MGTIAYDRSLLRLVRVRHVDLGDNHGTDLDVFMDKLNQFMEDVTEGNDVQIISQAGTIWAEETRLETDEEYNARIAAIRESQRKVQSRADASWERQKRKFARARNKK